MKGTMKDTSVVMLFLAATLAFFITPANAAVGMNEAIPVSFPVFVPCANGGIGETVDFSGMIHVLVSATINGNNVSGTMHTNFEGLAGIGETTGFTYVASRIFSEGFKTSLQNGQAIMTLITHAVA